MAGHLKKRASKTQEEYEDDVDPDTFLFEDDDEDLDESDLPPERDTMDDDDDDFEDDFDDEIDEWD